MSMNNRWGMVGIFKPTGTLHHHDNGSHDASKSRRRPRRDEHVWQYKRFTPCRRSLLLTPPTPGDYSKTKYPLRTKPLISGRYLFSHAGSQFIREKNY